jgi:hypothetical protein
MILSNEVIGQSVILASILAGFALSVASNVALGDKRGEDVTVALFTMMFSGICFLTAIAVATLYFMNSGDLQDQSTLAAVFLGSLIFGGVGFMFSFAALVRVYFAVPTTPVGAVIIFILIVFVPITLIFWLLIITGF